MFESVGMTLWSLAGWRVGVDVVRWSMRGMEGGGENWGGDPTLWNRSDFELLGFCAVGIAEIMSWMDA